MDSIEINKKYKEERKSAKKIIGEKRKVSSLINKRKTKKKVTIDKKPVKKKSKSRSVLVKELDAIYSKYIRLRDSDNKWMCTCVTCWAIASWQEMHNTHFITRANYKYRRDDDNCFAGCPRCNIWLKWNYIAYTLVMIKKYWRQFVEDRQADKELVKISTAQIEEMILTYKQKADLLLKGKDVRVK